jgi:DNA-binding GntR family transcriptional regulator
MRQTEATSDVRSIARLTLAGSVYTSLRRAIVNGEFADGMELNQVTLAERFGVSRSPVREALQRLMAENLVIGDSYHKVVVATLGGRELREMMSIREQLEVFAVREVLASGRPIDLKQARKLNADFGVDANDGHRIEIDIELHSMFMAETPVTRTIVEDIRTRIQKYVGGAQGGAGRRADAQREHAAILRAIEARDAELTTTLLRHHIDQTRALLTDRVGAAGNPRPDQ